MPRNKYRAKKTKLFGIVFDSKREAERYLVLKEMERNGEISGLERQKTFDLHGRDGKVVCRYRVDFVYREGSRWIADDAKGYRTRDYAIKRKLFIAEYGHEWEHRET